MIDTTVQLICDWCESAYPADPRATGSAVVIRVAARNDGWKTIDRGRGLKDVCPECRTENA